MPPHAVSVPTGTNRPGATLKVVPVSTRPSPAAYVVLLSVSVSTSAPHTTLPVAGSSPRTLSVPLHAVSVPTGTYAPGRTLNTLPSSTSPSPAA